jgi:hypothetical protein
MLTVAQRSVVGQTRSVNPRLFPFYGHLKPVLPTDEREGLNIAGRKVKQNKLGKVTHFP